MSEKTTIFRIINVLFLSSIYIGSVTVSSLYDKYIFVEEIENKQNIKFFEHFMHPIFLTYNMFLGEALCIPFYLIILVIFKQNFPKITKRTFFLMLLPSFLDSSFSTILIYGFMMTAPSVIKSLTGIALLTNMLLGYFILKKRYSLNSWMGAVFIIIGAFNVGYAVIYVKGIGHTTPLGLSIIICYLIVSRFQFIVEEKLLSIDKVDPLLLVSVEGITGLIYTTIYLFIFLNIPCSPIEQDDYALCAYNHIEDLNIAFKQISLSPILIKYFLLQIVAEAFFNTFGLIITKTLSSNNRTILGFSSTIIVWTYSVLVGWENLNIMQLFGYIIIVTGVFMFNGIIDFYNEITPPSIPLIRNKS